MSFTSGIADASVKPQSGASGRRRQAGILGEGTDPTSDSQVILACAVVGYTVSRLNKGLEARFDMESLSNSLDDERTWKAEFDAITDVVKRVDRSAKSWPGFKKAPVGTARVGFTPIWTETNDNRIVGSVKNDANDKRWDGMRFDPPLPTDVAGSKLYEALKSQGPITLGYQGSGAYTGFVQGREDGGQRNAFSTYRHAIPDDQPRWRPTQTPEGAVPLPVDASRPAASEGHWGMILPAAKEIEILQNQQGMYLQDLDTRRPRAPSADREPIFGYTHGMIQAIYDVELWKLTGSKRPGVPYEIAVGKKTCKLASCFCCAVFMEATGYPASAVHLGRADSWAPLYPDSPTPGAKPDPTTKENRSRFDSNARWETYCKEIIDNGLACSRSFIAEGKLPSFDALARYVQSKDALAYASLLLDAVTIHGSIYKAVDKALKSAA